MAHRDLQKKSVANVIRYWGRGHTDSEGITPRHYLKGTHLMITNSTPNKITPALSGRSAMILGMIAKGHRMAVKINRA